MSDIDRLVRIASTLTTAKLKLLTEMAQAMTRPVQFEPEDGSGKEHFAREDHHLQADGGTLDTRL